MKKTAFVFSFLFFLMPVHLFAQNEHQLLTELLKENVANGIVRYSDLCADQKLDDYIAWLSKTNPELLPSDRSRLAFWINAYNAWTLRIICDHYPLKSINELHSGGLAIGMLLKTTVWDKKIITINHEKTSLSFIEHNIIRPIFNDPRIHFALVCAAKGCPPLRSEAYEGFKLDHQLNEQGKIFLSQESKNRFDLGNKIASISPIFHWFRSDFGTHKENVLSFISSFTDPETSKALNENPSRWRIRYTSYDWSLNE